MKKADYADFIKRLPRADLPVAGVDAYLLSAPQAQAAFFVLPAGASVPPHAHGEQWGIIVEGDIELTIGGVTHLLKRGDSYYIGDQVVHSGVTHNGCLAIDVFADPGRYKARG
ncbi:MAG: cupin domain-containing protein [Thermodesulfobacteriota bacterium]